MSFFYQPKMDKVEQLRKQLLTEYEAKYGVKDHTVHRKSNESTASEVGDGETESELGEKPVAAEMPPPPPQPHTADQETCLLEGKLSERMVVHSDGEYKIIIFGETIRCINPSRRTIQLLELLDKPTFCEFAVKFNSGFEKNLDILFKEEFDVTEIEVNTPEPEQPVEPELKKDFTEAVKSLQKEFSVDDEDTLFGRNRKVDRRVRSSKRKRY